MARIGATAACRWCQLSCGTRQCPGLWDIVALLLWGSDPGSVVFLAVEYWVSRFVSLGDSFLIFHFKIVWVWSLTSKR